MRQAKIRYLEVFHKDIHEIIDYIRNTLNNNEAANRLVDEINDAIINRSYFPKAFQPYNSDKKREHIFYRLNVKNYVIFYIVIEAEEPIMEIHRIMYAKRNIDYVLA